VNDLIDTTEMYLRIIFELEEEGIVPLRARIAERLNQSGPTVSQTVARMERDGLVVLSGDRHLQLTDLGRQRATSVMRKHRLAERLLLDVIGLDWAEVHVEACRWEHVMSDAVENRLVELLDDPHISPYGNPIPPALDPDAPAGMTPVAPGTPADEVAAGGPFQVVRIIETVQNEPEIMAKLHAAGIVPGAEVTLDTDAARGRLTITGPTGAVDVSADTATGIRVQAA
jgi:DtxR family Mn-dependent transcriptional regulator